MNIIEKYFDKSYFQQLECFKNKTIKQLVFISSVKSTFTILYKVRIIDSDNITN